MGEAARERMDAPTRASSAAPVSADPFSYDAQLPPVDFRRMLRAAAAESGRSRLALLWEMAGFFAGPRRIFAHEYFQHRLYDSARYSPEEKRAFVGVLASRRLNRWLNDKPEGRGIVSHKLLFTAMLRGMGIPTTELQAFACLDWRAGATRTLSTAAAIAGFLRDDARYPLFGKPIDDAGSRGAVSVDAYEPEGDALRLIDGRRIAVEAFAAATIARYGGRGYLFETRLRPHPALRPVTGDSIGCVRLVTLQTLEGPVIGQALWKVTRSDSTADSISRPGAFLAGVAPETGRLFRAQAGSGPSRRIIERHPETGVDLADFQLPDWEAACALVTGAASATFGTTIIGWDVALTDRGPLIVEGNGDTNHAMWQLAADHGALSPAFLALTDRAIAANRRRIAIRSALINKNRRDLVARYAQKLRRDFWRA